MRNLNDIVKDIVVRLDENSLVVQKDGDAGDSAYRSGIFSFLLTILNHPQANDYYNVMSHNLQFSPGILHRTANVHHWGFNPNNMSRDNATSIMLAASVQKDDKLINLYYENAHHRSELTQIPKYGLILNKLNWFVGFHQNVHPGTDAPPEFRKVPDLIGISEVRNEIRRKHQWWKYPLLCLYDIGFLVDLHFRKNQLWDFDSLYAKDLIYATTNMPTVFSHIARKLYAKTDYIDRIRFNYADVNNGVEPLGELYELACRRYINGN